MSIFTSAVDEMDERMDSTASDGTPARTAAETASLSERAVEVQVAGQTIEVKEPDTTQTTEGGSWITGSGKYGVPRGADAFEARQIVQTSAMQAITNGIVDQLVGGELVFESDRDTLSETAQRLRTILRDVITGPHLKDEDLDDLITATVEDMLGPGDAYWQLLGPADGSGIDLPVVSLATLDALTIRRNVNRHGYPKTPPYYQAQGAFSSDGVAPLSNVDPTPLTSDQLAVMHYPRGNRSYRIYPQSPALQVKNWLQILADSTTHHGRFYSDNKIPPGLIQIIGESNVGEVKDKIQSASGDPRDVPVIGGDGGAQWIELGGTAVNLNIIEEQRWFFQMCLASLGLGKQELGFIEDVNRSNGEVEATRIYKRIAGPFSEQFEQAFRHIARRFEAYTALDEPFTPAIRFNDPREDRARAERLRKEYEAGTLPLEQLLMRRGDEQLADQDLTIEVGGETIDYGSHPKWIVQERLRAARQDTPEDAAEDIAETVENAAGDDPNINLPE